MAALRAIPEPLTGDAELDEEIEKFECRGDWTEDRKEVLKNLTGAEIDAEIMRLQAEHPERYLTPEELWEKIRLTEEAQPAKRRVEMAGA